MNCGSLKVLRFNRLVPYPEALILQQHLVSKKLMNRSNEPDYLIVLEHEPCVTLGRRCHSESDSIKSSYPIFKVCTWVFIFIFIF
jgi:lipoate-protein ligase B